MNKYKIFFEKPYEEISQVLNTFLRDNNTIIDIGCGDGILEDKIENFKECTIHCVDLDKESLDKLLYKGYRNNIIPYLDDANKFIRGYYRRDVDVILLNATLHEINDHANKEQYISCIFEKFSQILKPNGIVVVGDYFYPEYLSDKEIEKFVEYQKAVIGHADPGYKFVNPALLEKVARNKRFALEYESDIRAVEEIDRRYYIRVFRNPSNSTNSSLLNS